MRLRPNEIPEKWRKEIEAQGIAIQQPVKRGKKQPVNPAWWTGKEKDFQREVELWLELMGFAKRSKKSILTTQGGGGKHGWQLHFPRNIGNPYLGDILLLRNDGEYLEIELKTATGELSDVQSLLFSKRMVCRSLDEVAGLVAKWMDKQGEL